VISAIGCGGGNRPSDLSSSQIKTESAQEVKELNSKLIAQSSLAHPSPADYLIGPADLLGIKVFESEKLTSEVRVSSRGQITLPLLGSIDVNDLTAREAEEKIENLLKKGGYINNPHVAVFIKEYKSKLVSVVGFVKEPGSYDLLGKQTLLDALAAAKGLEDKAGRTIYLTRAGENGKKQVYVVDLDEILVKGDSGRNLELKAGDVIYVPEAGTVFVDGAVKKRGSYSLTQSATVSQSITMAGGLASYANNDVTLIRYSGNGKREIIKLNLGKIQKGEADDPIVKDRDNIIVGVNPIKKFVYGISINYFFFGGSYRPPSE
jgi:polysaccharide export outer membrane protein